MDDWFKDLTNGKSRLERAKANIQVEILEEMKPFQIDQAKCLYLEDRMSFVSKLRQKLEIWEREDWPVAIQFYGADKLGITAEMMAKVPVEGN